MCEGCGTPSAFIRGGGGVRSGKADLLSETKYFIHVFSLSRRLLICWWYYCGFLHRIVMFRRFGGTYCLIFRGDSVRFKWMLKCLKGRDLRIVMQICRKFDQSELWDGANTDALEPHISSFPGASASTWTRFSHPWKMEAVRVPEMSDISATQRRNPNEKRSTKYFILWVVWYPALQRSLKYTYSDLGSISSLILLLLLFPKCEKYYEGHFII